MICINYTIFIYIHTSISLFPHRMQVCLPTFTIEKDHPNVGKDGSFSHGILYGGLLELQELRPLYRREVASHCWEAKQNMA